MRSGSNDANGDTCIIPLKRSCLGRGFSIEFFEIKGVVAETASLIFSSMLPWDASRSFLLESFSSGRSGFPNLLLSPSTSFLSPS
jgi:hypothetical protein